MFEIPIQYIYFVIAMMLSGHGDASKISVTKDSNAVIAWTKQADGTWNAQEMSGGQAKDAGMWSVVATEKMMVLVHTGGSGAYAVVKTVNVSRFIKVGEGKPDPETIDISGQTFNVATSGNDVTLTPKDNTEHHITIHYGQADAAAPADAAAASPTPAPAAAPAPMAPPPAADAVAPATPPTPAAPSTPAAAAPVAGKYTGEDNNATSVELKADGTFLFHEGGSEIHGTYKVDGDALTMTTDGGDSMKAKISGNEIIPTAGGHGQKMLKQ